MSDESPKKAAAAGAPAWVMTFADLMSLLMCFFVLLLSFSEMDVAKYKQIAGSMKEAFGVQRKNPVKEPPKGINIIAAEFSAGRPNPTPFNVIEQKTSDELKQFLDTGGHQRRAGDEGKSLKGKLAGAEAKQDSSQARNDASAQAANPGGADGQDQTAADTSDKPRADQLVMLPKEDALNALKAKQRERRLQQSAKEIRAALSTEIANGAVDVETEGQKIVIRIREKASFPSGAAELREDFRPILDRVGQILKDTEGRIIVSGHTDDRPIATSLYRSNWDLSASRAVSVVHELIDVSRIPSKRFSIEGLAETRPVVPNDSVENRAKNRRVEIKLLQGDDLETQGTLGLKPVPAAPAGSAAPVRAPKAQPASDDPFVRKAG